MDYTVVIDPLPRTLEAMKELKEAGLKTPEDTAALTVCALDVYPENPQECIRMLDYLRGPRPLSEMEKQFLRDRFMDGKDYLARSYMAGSSPDNDYQPSSPCTIRMSDSHAPIAEEGYRIMDLKSSGADTARTITLRNKPSTGEWFLWEQTLLAMIREPKSKDPWA
ncbi:MAG: hypothetical protein J6S26_00930 [Solobacterium sp.]|nr:hypothetical protein [Solobacterium sp.]